MTPTRLMRKLLRPSLAQPNIASNALRAGVTAAAPSSSSSYSRSCVDPQSCISDCHCFAHVNVESSVRNREIWVTTKPRHSAADIHGDHKPPDERAIKLGTTVRILHERLPTLLKEPLPSEILAPSITLHLFPTTHPHLPTVSGRLAYVAALWTAPVAWGRMPLIGNVHLTILSERMVRNGGTGMGSADGDEKLIVKWKTCGKPAQRDGTGGIYRGMGLASAKEPVKKIKGFISGRSAETQNADDGEDFCGFFVFEFDEQGRITKHTIEHTDEGGRWDKMTRVVSVTDWLLGQFNGKKKEEEAALAWCAERPKCGPVREVDRKEHF